MITASDITKTYPAGKNGRITALSGISLDIRKGELFGLIGPDGAGKTSLFRILTTLLLPDKGMASVAGYDVRTQYRQIRREVGYMPGRFSLYQDLSVEENLTFFATVFHTTIQENYHLIRDIYEQIEPFKDRKAGKLSGGMKQKLALCCALIHKPAVLFLDEPTTGVDPVSRKEFWDMLDRLKEQDITILVSTPYMDEAVRCDRVALMYSGNILTVDTPAGIRGQFPFYLWKVQARDMYRLLGDLREYPGVISCYAFGDAHHLTVKDRAFDSRAIDTWLLAKGHTDIRISPIDPSIEDCFMQLGKSSV